MVTTLLAPLLLLFAQSAKPAPPKPVSFQREVLPILRTACLGCHGGAKPDAGLSLGSYAELMKGSRNGAIVAPGKSGESKLVGTIAGAMKPLMPPGGGLKPGDIDTIRRWVDAGAKNDTPVASAGPNKAPIAAAAGGAPHKYAPLGVLRSAPAPINALAFSADGKWLAVGTYRRVLLCDPQTRTTQVVWPGHADTVRALAFSPDGKWLAAAGGPPGAFGEVRLWSVAERKETALFGDHTDTIQALAFSPDSKWLATGSADKSVKIWEATTGKLVQTLRDHADAVLGVAYHPSGKWLATCGADKSIKIWDTTSWKRLYTVGQDESVVSVAFLPGGQFITTSADRTFRVWNFGPEGSGEARRLGGHNGTVWAESASGDGKLVATASADKSVRLWNPENGAQIATFTDAKDCLYAVRLSPDGKRVAGGGFDGTLYVWSVESKKLEGTVPTWP